ncbi:hypothetical protein D7V93_31145 [Corallococcus llansteffanensis]|uniref:Uncharacterized protein n=1 Tax=Corallococcus llansteffanensis TaxID=2316731 RepID=A0A3A8P095_9BACT|nr:hypothetical protein D7V93_31145 [Corallococcus llansteffanensis]
MRANLRAVRLAAPGKAELPPDAERTRKAAYFNLHALGVSVALPGPGQCSPLTKASACKAPVYGCGAKWTEHGSGGGSSGAAVNLALSEQAAALGKLAQGTEDTVARPKRGVLLGIEGSPPREKMPSSLVLTEEEAEVFTGPCARHSEWSCGSSAAVRGAADTCRARAGGCDGGVMDCPSALRCSEEACAEAERSPSPAVRAEQQLAWQTVDRCGTEPLPHTSCSVVLADACLGLVGVVCETSTVARDGKVLEKTSPEVGEVWLQRTEP